MRHQRDSVTRRDFVRDTLSVMAAGVAVGSPFGLTACTGASLAAPDLWARPALLGALGVERVLRIGKAWTAEHPDERSAIDLQTAIARTAGARRAMDAASISDIILRDFDSNRIVVVDGWMLSVTEARQCALYALTRG